MEIRPAWQNSAFIIELSNGTQWNSWQNDVIIEAKRIPVFANIEENQEKMLGQDGLYDFGTEYENAVIELDVVVRADSIDNRIAKVAEIARLLNPKNGFQKMIFGDRPSVYYMVKVNNTMQQDLTKHKDLSYFTISLNAHPYAYKTGTSVTFTGNGTDGIEMLVETKTDADVPFRMEIGGNLEVKAPDFWDKKDDSKNIIPNPRFMKDINGDAVKWNVSKEYSSEEDFYKEFGYVKQYPVYSDTQVDFINKIKNGTYTAEEFKIMITYAADTKGYLVRTYHYYINNFEVYTTTDTLEAIDWLGFYEYDTEKIRRDVKDVVKKLTPKIYISSFLEDHYDAKYVFTGILDTYGYMDKDNTWFLTHTVEKSYNINKDGKIDFKSLYLDVREGKTKIKEITLKQYFTVDKKNIIYEILANGIFMYRHSQADTYYIYKDFPDITHINFLLSGTFGTPSVAALKIERKTLTQYNVALPVNRRITAKADDVWSQSWQIVDGVIQTKEINATSIGDIKDNNIHLLIYQEDVGQFPSYVAVFYVNNVVIAKKYLSSKYFINTFLTSFKDTLTDICNIFGLTNNITDDVLKTAFADLPEMWEEHSPEWYILPIDANKSILPPVKSVAIEDKTAEWFEPEHKLPIPAQNQNTITVSFAEQKLMQITHNALTFNLAPFYSEFESRYRYVYSDVIGLDALNKDYVLSAYLRDNRGKFGLIILDNNEVFKRVVLRTPQDYTDWSREYFTENLKAEDKKVIVFFEAVNTTHETDTLVMEFALPQLEVFPLSDFTENSTLYSLEARVRKNLVDNAGFKFSNDGRMDRWGWTDNSSNMITKQYTAADLPKDLSGKSLGYGVVEITCADNSTNNYSAYLSQTIRKIKPLTTYTLSTYLKENGDTTVLKAKLTIVQKNANSAIIDAKTKELMLTTAWALYSHTVTTKADATSVEIRIEIEKKGFALTSPAVIKAGAIQFEENSMATYWEDDNWETEYLVASKNLLYNPTFGAIAGENLPNGWDKVIDSPKGIANTTISLTKATVVGGIERPAVRFDFNDEIDDNVAIWLKNKPFAVNENRYYAISLYCRAKNVVNSIDLIAHTIKVKISFIDTNGVVIAENVQDPNLITSTDIWGRYQITFPENAVQAPAGAVSCVVSIGVTKLDYVGDGAYAEFSCIQVEEVSNWDSSMTSWEDNYTFTVKPPEQHSTIKPVYIRNPKIYRADGTLFFAWTGTILNTERITVDTEKFQAYVTKEDGTKINILDDVFIYIYNRLDKQILSTDKMYLRYVDESGLNENTQEPVAVTVKIDWTARTF